MLGLRCGIIGHHTKGKLMILTTSYSCDTCNFYSTDKRLAERHSCDVAQNGGSCEDFPACGHEFGDCNGLLYGSDESIKEDVYRAIATGHGECDHQDGLYRCEGYDETECEGECGDDSDCDECYVSLSDRVDA